MSPRHPRLTRHAFSMTEMLVVIAVFVALMGLLFPLLAGFRKSGQMTKSMAHMKQIAGWMTLYAGDNRDFVLPSQFDYSQDAYPGKVRSTFTDVPFLDKPHEGTWADIIWSEYKLGVFPEALPPLPQGFGQDFRHDSPDGLFYGQQMIGDQPGFDFELDNPLRSAAPNSRDTFSVHDVATPYGAGAGEKGLPGYFAANNFFNADAQASDVRDPSRPVPGARWYTHGQIRVPERSMYLVDSFAGEVIQPWADRYKPEIVHGGPSSGNQDGNDPSQNVDEENQVDFRYSGLCLMLFLDGHSETQDKWDGIEELEGFVELDPQGKINTTFGDYDPANRGIRIRALDRRISSLMP